MANMTKKQVDDLFDFSETSFVNEKTESELYKPDHKNGKGGIYEAVIRFVPFYKDKKLSLIERYICYNLDHSEKGKKIIDSKRTTQGNNNCKIVDTFFKLYGSGDAKMKERSKMFQQTYQSFALVQILEDKNNPHLEGKIKVFKFGVKLKEIYDRQEKPTKGKSRNPFDPYNGRALNLYVTSMGGNNDYTKSTFLEDSEEEYPLLINGKPISEVEDKETILTYLKENSPDLSKYVSKEWDEETEEYLDAVIEEVLGKSSNSRLVEDVRKKSNVSLDDDDDDEITVTKKSSKTTSKSKAVEEDDDDEFDIDSDIKSSKPTSSSKTKADLDDDDDMSFDDDIDFD